MHLIAHVVHQRDAALDTRERLLATLSSGPGRVVLATCHRVEAYEVGVAPTDVPEMRTLLDDEAAAHLFRAATGLDSTIAGEPQILRQVRAAYGSSAGLHPLLRRLFERALHVGREIRRSTRVGEVRRSVGSLAVDDALRLLGDPASAVILVIGAGEMGKLAVRALSRRVARVLVANRDRSRADSVAAESGAEALALDDVPVAIAVPRSVPADARGLAGLVYRNIDDLAGDHAAIPRDEIARASDRCVREARRFMKEWRERAAVDAIRDVRATAEALRKAQLARALRRLGHLGDRDRRIVEALSVGLTNSLLHAPTIALREEPSRGIAARELFGLDRERA